MRYDIYFHNDFDGAASAAVMYAFFESRRDGVGRLIPVDYTIGSKWEKLRFRNPAVIVDFMYHPRAAFWFDHHPTAFKKKSWEKQFRQNKFKRWNARYASCCHLVLDSLVRGFGFRPPPHFRELAKWLDVVDGANYRSPRQAIEMKEPAIQIYNYLKRYGDARKGRKVFKFLIPLLAEKPLRSIVRLSRIRKAVSRLRAERAALLSGYRRYIAIRGNTAYSDLAKHNLKRIWGASYYFYPKVLYGISTQKGKDGMVHVSVGASPWKRRKSKIHIGKLLRRYGGGGHKDAGGVEFRNIREAQAAAEKIIKTLNHEK